MYKSITMQLCHFCNCTAWACDNVKW